MKDADRLPDSEAIDATSYGDTASLRSTLLAAASGARHLGDISKNLERIACALERMAERTPRA